MKKRFQKKISKKYLKSFTEFDNHFLVVRINNKIAKLDGFIAVHRKNKSLPSFGATRLWNYSSENDALKDVLRLSKLMSYKSALAGLPYGGAKAVIIKPKGKFSREKLLEAYAEELNKLKGIFVTGTDVGLDVSDLKYMKKYTKYLIGYSSNPEKATALGLIKSINTALLYVYKTKSYKNKSFAIQGVGKVGSNLLEKLIKKGVKEIYIADTDKNKIKIITQKYPFVKVVSPDKIHSQEVDFYCPCALSGALNKKSIKNLNCKVIVGSANNQLRDVYIGEELHRMGIFYCPDYVVNSGGLISVIDEYLYNKSNNVRLTKKINKIL